MSIATERAPRSGGRRTPTGGSPIAGPAGRTTEYRTRGATALAPERLAAAPSRATEPAAEPPRLRVAPPVPVAVPRAPFVLLVLVLVVGGVLGILLVNTKINENAFRLQRLQQQQAALDLREQQLEQQIAESSSPGSLAAQARKLGLVPAGTPAFIRLPDGRVIGVPQPAGGRPSIASQHGDGR
jgi:cell division protein FtsB